jgi:hypothetical protein
LVPGGTHGGRGSQFGRGDIHCGTVGIQYMYFVGGKYSTSSRERKRGGEGKAGLWRREEEKAMREKKK